MGNIRFGNYWRDFDSEDDTHGRCYARSKDPVSGVVEFWFSNSYNNPMLNSIVIKIFRSRGTLSFHNEIVGRPNITISDAMLNWKG